jgi:hypothetical protein
VIVWIILNSMFLILTFISNFQEMSARNKSKHEKNNKSLMQMLIWNKFEKSDFQYIRGIECDMFNLQLLSLFSIILCYIAWGIKMSACSCAYRETKSLYLGITISWSAIIVIELLLCVSKEFRTSKYIFGYLLKFNNYNIYFTIIYTIIVAPSVMLI